MPAQSPLYCSVLGCGEPVVFVHGDSLFGNPVEHWTEQLELAQEYQLIIPARHGYYLSPPPEREAFDVYARAIADLLGEGAHLVGHSYGGVVALLAAAMRPEAVYSLAVSEPAAFSLARGNADVERFITRVQARSKPLSEMTPEEFTLHLHNAIFGTGGQLPQKVLDVLATPFGRKGTEANMREPGPWEAAIPLEALAKASFPKLVLSSRTIPMHEIVCEVLVENLGAEHAVISEKGHFIPLTGKPYNDCLRDFWRRSCVDKKA